VNFFDNFQFQEENEKKLEERLSVELLILTVLRTKTYRSATSRQFLLCKQINFTTIVVDFFL
jgi:hypothetical protein